MRHTLKLALAVMALPICTEAQDTRSFTDDLGRMVAVPAAPKRIVVTESQSLAVPLIELGLMPVGSQGMMFDGVNAQLRGSAVTTGVTFETGPVEFIGFLELDVEAITALEPDLILHSLEVEPYTGVSADKLSAIAPVVALNSFQRTLTDHHAVLAEITGATADETRLRARYDTQLTQLTGLTDPGNTTVSTFMPDEGTLYAEHTWGILGQILREGGYQTPSIIDDITPGEGASFSAERLADFDADWIVLTYRTDAGETPADLDAQMEAIVPNWCEALQACREGRVIFMPRDEATTPSYAAASAVMFSLVSHMADPYGQRSE